MSFASSRCCCSCSCIVFFLFFSRFFGERKGGGGGGEGVWIGDGRTDGLSRAECERRTLVGGRKVYENGMGGVGDEVEG